MKKLLTILLLAAFAVLTMSGCSMGIDANGGSIAAELTKLSAPYGITYDDGTKTVSWAEIDNASGYYIQINGQNPIGKLQNNYYVVSFDSDCSFTVSVKACGNGIVFSDSDWNNHDTTFTYTHSGASSPGFADQYQSNGIGRAINFIDGSTFEPMSGAVSIFDLEKLYSNYLIEETIGTQKATVVSGNSMSSFMDSYSLDAGLKVGMGSSATDKDKAPKYRAGSLDFNFDINGGYNKQTAAETNQMFYKLQQTIVGKRIEINNYRDAEQFAAMLSEEFKKDAWKVNEGIMSAAAFVNKYGTHVIMSAYYGGSIEATYYAISNKSESNDEYFTNLEAGLTYHLTRSREVGGEIYAKYSNIHSESKSDFISTFNVKAMGGTSQSFGSMDSFAASYDAWARSVTPDTYSIIDVPNGSLYCVWDYLDDSYAYAKKVLNAYLYDNCDEAYYDMLDKVGKFLLADDVEYDEQTKTLTINLARYQDRGSVDTLNSSYFTDKLFTVYPMVNGKEIHTVVIKGAYNTRDMNGVIIKTLINDFGIKFDSSWYTSPTIILENVGLKRDFAHSIIDTGELDDELTVTIVIKGSNSLDGGTAIEDNAICTVKAGNIIISGDGSMLITGADQASSADCGIAISARDLTIDMSGELTVIGGDGKDGTTGSTGETGAKGDDGLNQVSGQDGGTGGAGANGSKGIDGAAAVEASSIIIKNGIITLVGGNGGNGGAGGTGGVGGIGGIGWAGVIGSAGGGNGGAGGMGGIGGKGGTGGIPVKCESIEIVSGSLLLKNGAGGAGGVGGKGGQGGNGGDTSQWGAYCGWPGGGGSGGLGGRGGSGGDIIDIESIITVQKSAGATLKIDNNYIGKGGAGGFGGTIGTPGKAALDRPHFDNGTDNSGNQAQNGTDGSLIK